MFDTTIPNLICHAKYRRSAIQSRRERVHVPYVAQRTTSFECICASLGVNAFLPCGSSLDNAHCQARFFVREISNAFFNSLMMISTFASPSPHGVTCHAYECSFHQPLSLWAITLVGRLTLSVSQVMNGSAVVIAGPELHCVPCESLQYSKTIHNTVGTAVRF